MVNDNDGLIRDTLAGIANAVTEEMSAVAADPSSRYLLRFGRFIGRVGPNHLWSFECLSLIHISEPTRPY